MKKGTILKNKSGKEYTVVGYFGGDIVLAPNAENDDRVMIYTKNEMNDLICEGGWTIIK